jgi:hypothetical protein
MTANLNRKLELDDVLAEITTGAEPPDANSLRVWVTKYPQFSHAIIELVTDWIATDALRSKHVPGVDEVNLVVNRTMSRVQMMLDEAERPKLLTDMAADIQRVGHDMESFQRSVGIDRSLLDSLVARLVKPATVPAELVRRLASSLRRHVDTVRAYLRLEPQLRAAYKARGQPEVKQVDFCYLVQHAELSEQDKALWLAEPADPFLQE